MTKTVTLGGRQFAVEQTEHGTFLTGTRGGRFYLRPFLGEETGLRQVVSLKTGEPLRDKAYREVIAVEVGGVVEQHRPQTVRA